MKILSLKFKNISSLLGEWEIRFDRPPLSDTGLFAIVGPNGSGKSSILDALTLGLYGETARLRNPEMEITNWQADESYSEVTFRVGGDLFRSRWWVRKGNGAPMSPEMSLSGLNGSESLLEDRVIRVRSRIAELTGLDFKRFCRSVLLAQGEFTALLKALENERVEILEKVIGAEVAEEIERAIRGRAREERERLLQLKESAAGFDVVDRERLKGLEQALEGYQAAMDEARRRLEEVEALRERLAEVERLESVRQNALEVLDEAEARGAKARKALERLENARVTLPFAEELNELDQLDARREAARKELQDIREGIPSNEGRLRDLEERLAVSRADPEYCRKQLEERGEELADALARDREIEAQTRRFLDTVSHYEAVERARKDAIQQQESLTARIAEGSMQAERVQHSMEQHAVDGELESAMSVLEARVDRLVSLRGRLGECQARITDARKLEEMALKVFRRAERVEARTRLKADRVLQRKEGIEQHLSDLLGAETLDSLAARIQAHKTRTAACRQLLDLARQAREAELSPSIGSEQEGVTNQLEAIKEELTLEQERLKELEPRIGWRDTFKRLNIDRSSLEAGNPCPLCGALHHPFLETGLPDFSELNGTVEAIEARIDTLEAEVRDLSEQAARLSAQSLTAEKLQQEWLAACERAEGSWPFGEVEPIQEELLAMETADKQARSLIRSSRWRKWRLSWLGMILNRRLDKLAQKESKRSALQDQLELRRKALDDLDADWKGLNEEATAVQADLTERLRAYGETAPEPGGETTLLGRLRRRRDDHIRERAERDALSREARELTARRDALDPEIDRLRGEAEALSAETESIQAALGHLKDEREALYADLDPAQEKQGLNETMTHLAEEQGEWAQEIDSLLQALEVQRRSLPRLEHDFEAGLAAHEARKAGLLERLQGAGIGSLKALREGLATLAEEQLLIDEAQVTQQALSEARTNADAAEQALEAAREGRGAEAALPSIEHRISEAVKTCDDLREKVEETERILTAQKRIEAEYGELLRAIEDQESISAGAALEEDMLRAENGGEIRRKLHRLMLDRLVEQANVHLGLLSGRYVLRTAQIDGLGFEVEDSAQQKVRRSIETLSGGELFVVSLCLALGLADLAASHRRIESLFLDEGFGTLDDETLYKVMAALKRLRSNGKVVGVISHVKRLADEIPTQIRVEREAGGRSRLTVVA